MTADAAHVFYCVDNGCPARLDDVLKFLRPFKLVH